ncbi:MAG: hypothetical protein GY869_08615 [Planctomycetes bacterium]|nr:hypothetical protein [Planctomycetota bacterium]
MFILGLKVSFSQRKQLTIIAVLVILPAVSVHAQTDDKPVWLAVTRPIFVSTLEPLAQKRTADGFHVVISTEPIDDAIASCPHEPNYLVIVGDYQKNYQDEPWFMPTRIRKFYQFNYGQRDVYAADPLWGDLNNDLVPDLPVGRIPVRTTEQLQLVINKILTYENQTPDPNNLSLLVWAGSPNYNPVLDNLVITLGANLVKQNAPDWMQMWSIIAHSQNPLCGWPPDHNTLFNQQLQQNAALAVLIGHSRERSFLSMVHQGEYIEYTAPDKYYHPYSIYPIKQNDTETNTKISPSPVMTLITCYAGYFSGSINCLAESLLFMPDGPVTLVAATTESHPLTNAYTSLALLQNMDKNKKRIGDIWLNAQHQMLNTKNFILENILSKLENRFDVKLDITKLQRDQALMYTVLGDPAVKLPLPDPLTVTCQRTDDGWSWQAEKPKNATRLLISFRPQLQPLAFAQNPSDKQKTAQLFQQTNQTYAFTPHAKLHRNAPWEGNFNKQGTLRLIALGPNTIYTAAVKLEFNEKSR